MKIFRDIVSAGVALAITFTSVASYAQTPPRQSHSQHARTGDSDFAPAAPSPNSQRESDFVALSEFTQPGGTPMAARPGTFEATDIPIINEQRFLNRYYPNDPAGGAAAFRRISDANRTLCQRASGFLQQMMTLDQLFASAQEELAAISALYRSLQSEIRRATQIMTIAQAASAGALCLLTAGLYCIAAIVVAIGNIFVSAVNRRLQLAHIVLSIANIRLTRLNTDAQRLWLQMSAFWLDNGWPVCRRLFPSMAAAFDSFLSTRTAASAALVPAAAPAAPAVRPRGRPVRYRDVVNDYLSRDD